ncbi:uncharacterized protein G2W53_002409 [Senna tora]|uniref:Uncharacterized protein n=1 Tax=Senna tora TaxID=362788 RepID=A0A835CKB7_9FABA|nr:uncharacterized protein G2W53_002409 [Senna tora]
MVFYNRVFDPGLIARKASFKAVEFTHLNLKSMIINPSVARVVHIFREGNACADTLAKHAVISQSTFVSCCFAVK